MQSTIQALNQETINLTKAIFGAGSTVTPDEISKAGITVPLGLQGYELEAPAKSLYPALSPLRNQIARTKSPIGSTAAHWKAVTGINTANIKAAVAFGTRNGVITYAESDRSATYKSFGLEDLIDQEAVIMGRNFMDVRAFSALATLQSTMIEEEKLILGGVSTTNALGTPSIPTSGRTATSGGSWSTTDNVYCQVVALPLYGYLNSDRTGLTSLGDHSALSAVKSQAITATTDGINFAVTPLNGAWAYAWFAGEGASQPSLYLAAITTVPSVQLIAPPSSSHLAASTITADTSGDANAFDGLFPQILPIGNSLTTEDSSLTSGVLSIVNGGTLPPNSLVFDMNNDASANVGGTTLTADGAGGIKEIDLVLKYLWDISRIGPTMGIMNSQEALTITRTVAGVTAGTQVRVPVQDGDKGLVAGLYYSGYLNKFTGGMTPGSPDVIPLMIHPYVPPGTMVFISERLPYPNNKVPNVLEMEMQMEYTDMEFAMTTRQFPHGVYATGVLKHYFPAGCAVIRGIKPPA